MKSSSANAKSTRSEAQYLRIQRAVREQITSGTLSPGARLPPTLALCREWGARPCTVQSALAPLVREGLLQRRPRQGTIVASPGPRTLRRVALYCTGSFFREGSSAFERALYGALTCCLAERRAALDTWVDVRPVSRRGQAWTELVEAAQSRRVDAVIMLDPGRAQSGWVGRIPVPTVCMSSRPGRNVVSVDYAAVFTEGVHYLGQRGCRTLGTISAFGPSAAVGREALAALRRGAVEAGVELRDAWMHSPSRRPPSEAAFQQYGYDAMRALWAAARPRPEGVIVGDDVMLAGVVAALLELRVRLPGDLQVVGYKNSAIPVFAPLALAFVEISTHEIASALLAQLQKQMRGESLSRVLVAPRLRPAPPATGRRH